jgi:hypothetical protein
MVLNFTDPSRSSAVFPTTPVHIPIYLEFFDDGDERRRRRTCEQVRLVPYNPDYVDESVMWTESRDVGHGFRCVRMLNNIYLNFDAFHGDRDHGGVHDGTEIVLWEWAKGDNQRWKIVPWCKN